MRNSCTAKFYGEKNERRRFALYRSEFMSTKTDTVWQYHKTELAALTSRTFCFFDHVCRAETLDLRRMHTETAVWPRKV